MERFYPLRIRASPKRRTCGTENSVLAVAAALPRFELNCYSRNERGEETLAKISRCENRANRRNYRIPCIVCIIHFWNKNTTVSNVFGAQRLEKGKQAVRQRVSLLSVYQMLTATATSVTSRGMVILYED